MCLDSISLIIHLVILTFNKYLVSILCIQGTSDRVEQRSQQTQRKGIKS